MVRLSTLHKLLVMYTVISFCNFSFKFLLHAIVRIYSCKCVTNIVEQYEHCLVVGLVEICIQEQTATGNEPHNEFIYRCIIQHMQNCKKTCKTLVVMGTLTTLTRKSHVLKPLINFA